MIEQQENYLQLLREELSALWHQDVYKQRVEDAQTKLKEALEDYEKYTGRSYEPDLPQMR